MVLTRVITENRRIDFHGISAEYPYQLQGQIPKLIIVEIFKKNNEEGHVEKIENDFPILIPKENLRSSNQPKAIYIGKVRFPAETFKSMRVMEARDIINLTTA
jgi:hypothetical protein